MFVFVQQTGAVLDRGNKCRSSGYYKLRYVLPENVGL